MFTDIQKQQLQAKLDPKHVTQRTQSGRTLDYIEGWQAIAEANRIFGFDGWNRETVELVEVRRDQVNDKYGKPQWRIGYMAKVRIRVYADGLVPTREGTGFGSGAMGDLGEAIESAIKEAETDATKRALMTFGNPFGLALYDKTKANVGNDEPEKPQVSKADGRKVYADLVADMRRCDLPEDMNRWWKDPECAALRAQLPADWLSNLKDAFKEQKQDLLAKVEKDQQTPFA